VDYTSARLRDNVRQIEGGLKKLRAYRDLSGMELTLENIERTIDDLQTADKTLTITPDLVVRYVCKYYGIDEKQLKSQLRSRNVALPRQIAMYMIRHLTKMSFPNLGKYFDKDQATVQHGVRKIEMELRNGNTQLESIIRDIQLAIDGSV
jgi:chromosomal replication initiator protein